MTEFKPWPITPEQKAKLDAVKATLKQQYTWPFPVVNGAPTNHEAKICQNATTVTPTNPAPHT